MYQKFYDQASTRECASELFEFALSQNYIGSVIFLVELIDVAYISTATIEQAFSKMITACDKAILKFLLEELQKRNISEEQKEILFLTAATNENVDALYLLEQFHIPYSMRNRGLFQALRCGHKEIAKFIMSDYGYDQTEELYVQVQNYFVEFCHGRNISSLSALLSVFEKTHILSETLQQGFLLSLDNTTIDISAFLLQEFHHPWESANGLQAAFVKECRSSKRIKHMPELLSLILVHAGRRVPKVTWEETILESVSRGNNDALLILLTINEGDFLSAPSLEKTVKSCIETNNQIALLRLHEKFGLLSLTPDVLKNIFITAVEDGDAEILKLLLSFPENRCLGKDTLCYACEKASTQSNSLKMELLLSTGNCVADTLQICLVNAYETNCPSIAALLFEHLGSLRISNASIQHLLSKALDHQSDELLQLVFKKYGTRFFGQETLHKIYEVCCMNNSILEVVLVYLNVTNVDCAIIAIWAKLLIQKKDVESLQALMENIEVRQLELTDLQNIFMDAVRAEDVVMIKMLIAKFGLASIKRSSIEAAFRWACDRDNGDLLEFLIGDDMFGSSTIKDETISKSFLSAAEKNQANSVKVIIARYELHSDLRKKGIAIARRSNAKGVSAVLNPGGGSLGESFASAIQDAVEQIDDKTVEDFMETVGAVKDAFVKSVKDLFEDK